MKSTFYILAVVVIVLTSIGCQDKSGQTVTTITTVTTTLMNAEDSSGYVSDLSELEWMNADVTSIANTVGTTYNSADLRTMKTSVSSCASVGIDTISDPHQIVIRFGSSDCVCRDGRNRRGTIIVSFSGHFNDINSAHTITFDNYFVNDVQLTGQTVVTYMGVNSGSQPYYLVTLNDSVVKPFNSITSLTGNRVQTFIDGYTTADRNDDAYTTTGSGTLTRANGHVFATNITTPLQVALGCSFVESGVMSITSSAFTNGTRTLDFGPGNCDDMAKLTIDTFVYQVTFN